MTWTWPKLGNWPRLDSKAGIVTVQGKDADNLDELTRVLNSRLKGLETEIGRAPVELVVTEFGVLGNGIANDTATIQAVMTRGAAAGMPVVFPSDRTYVVDSLTTVTGTYLRFLGNATLKHKTNASAAMFVTSGSNLTVRVEGGTFDGNRANQSGRYALFDLDSITDFRIEDAKFTGSVQAGLLVDFASGGEARVDDCTFSDMAIHGGTTGQVSYAGRFYGAGSVWVNGCKASASTPAVDGKAPGGFLFDGGCRVMIDDIELDGVGQAFASNFVSPIQLYNANDDSMLSRIRIRTVRTNGLSLQESNRVSVSDVTIDGDDGSSTVGYGIDINPAARSPGSASRNITLSGVQVNGSNLGYGIRLHTQDTYQSRDVNISNFQVKAAKKGLWIDRFNGAVTVDGFSLGNCSNGAAGYGVEITNCDGRVKLAHGDIDAASDTAILANDGNSTGLILQVTDVTITDAGDRGLDLGDIDTAILTGVISRGANTEAIVVDGTVDTLITAGCTVDAGQTVDVSGATIGTALSYGTNFSIRATNADTSGATLGQLETEVNEIKQVLRDFGMVAA